MTKHIHHVLTITVTIVVALLSCSVRADSIWQNTGVGATAGDWFDANNWLPIQVPGPTNDAVITNGGEAKIDVLVAPPGPVDVLRLDVGRNGDGLITNNGVDLTATEGFSVGEVSGALAFGNAVVSSDGAGTLTDVATLIVGAAGVGDLDVGQSHAVDTAQSFATGNLLIERSTLVQVARDADVGETGGGSQAMGTGTLTLNNIGAFEIGHDMDVAETSTLTGISESHGTVIVDVATTLSTGNNLDIGRGFGSGGQETTHAMATFTDVETIDVSKALSVGAASAKNGGTASTNGTLSVTRGSTISIGAEFTVGSVLGTANTGQADALGSATFTDVGDISVGTDIRVGRNIAVDDVNTTANGTLMIDGANSIMVAQHLEVGRTGDGGAPLVGGSASGTGQVTIQNVVGAITTEKDIRVGRTSAVALNTGYSDGTLNLLGAGSLSVMGNVSVGNASGEGQSTSIGLATIGNVSTITVGGKIDVGRVTGSSTNANSGNGTLTISDANISLGFADALSPGGLVVGQSVTAGSSIAHASGVVTLERSDTLVADRIIVGDLTSALLPDGTVGPIGTNPATTADGQLNLIDSLATTPALDVATIEFGTAGTVSGQLHLTSSLVDVTGVTTFGTNATLMFDIGGTTRSTGTGGAGQYGAIDTASALLDGALQVNFIDAFVPTVGDSFSVIDFGTRSGQFATLDVFGLAAGLTVVPMYDANQLRLVIESVAIPGDGNGDGMVDGLDYLVWAQNFGHDPADNPPGSPANGDYDNNGKVDGLDYIVWATNFGVGTSVSVPEPSSLVLALIALSLITRCQRCRLLNSKCQR